MADAKQTLAIRTTLKDEASAKLKTMGVTGEKSGKRIEQSMKGVEVQSKATGKSMLEAGQAGSKGAGIAGAGFASLAAGMSAGTATAENMEAAMVSVGASVGAAFAAGGPVGAGLALAATGLGILIGKSKEAAAASKALGDSFVKMSTDAVAAISGIDQRIKSMMEDIYAFESVIDGTNFDRVARGLEAGVKGAREEINKAELGMKRLAEDFRLVDITNEKQLVVWERAVQDQEKLLGKAREGLKVAQERLARYYEANKATEKRVELEGESNELTEEGNTLWSNRVETVVEVTDEYEEQNKAIEEQVKKNEQLAEIQKRHIESQNRQTQRIIDANRSLQDRIDIITAETDKQADLVRLEQERRDLIEQGLDSLKVQEYYEARLLEISERYAESAEKGAGMEIAKATAAERTAKAHQQDLDITKKFAAAPGTGGVFGFGKGTVGFGGFTQGYGSKQRRKKAAPSGAGGADPAGGGGGGAALPDPSPQIDAAGADIAALRPLFDKMLESAKGLAKEARATYKETTDGVAGYAQVIATEVGAIKAELRSLKSRLSRSGDLAVAGGA